MRGGRAYPLENRCLKTSDKRYTKKHYIINPSNCDNKEP